MSNVGRMAYKLDLQFWDHAYISGVFLCIKHSANGSLAHHNK